MIRQVTVGTAAQEVLLFPLLHLQKSLHMLLHAIRLMFMILVRHTCLLLRC